MIVPKLRFLGSQSR